MKIELLNDCGLIITFATFVGSIAIFSDYLKRLNEFFDGPKSPVSRKLSKLVIFVNYLAILLVWICLIIVLLFSNTESYPNLYKVIVWILIFSTLCLTITLMGKWCASPINKILAKIKLFLLARKADEDLEELKKLKHK